MPPTKDELRQAQAMLDAREGRTRTAGAADHTDLARRLLESAGLHWVDVDVHDDNDPPVLSWNELHEVSDLLVEAANALTEAQADHAQREALTDTERDELDTLLGVVLLPTFTPRERDIARIAARAALRASAVPPRS